MITLSEKKIFRIKPQLPRIDNLPFFPSIFNSPKIVLKDDFFRIIKERNNRITGKKDVEIKLTIYYNIFALPFGYDNINIYFSSNGKRNTIKSIPLSDKLNSREQEIVGYIQRVIKHLKERQGLLKNFSKEQEDLFFKKFFSEKNENDPDSGVVLENIINKFPEISFLNGIAYLYTNSYYEESSKVNRGGLAQNIPFTKDFKEITKRISLIEEDNEFGITGFQKACFRKTFQKIDPLQVFIKSDFIKSSSARNKIVSLTQEDIDLVSEFMKANNIIPPVLLANTGRSDSALSDVCLVNSRTNLKKVTTTFVYPSFDLQKMKEINISLARGDDENSVFEIVKSFDSMKKQESIADVSRIHDLGNYPISIPRANSQLQGSSINDIVIEKKQFINDEIQVFASDRMISKNAMTNSGFNVKDLKAAGSRSLITTYDVASISDNSLVRNTVLNSRTGEFLINSAISPNKEMGLYKRSEAQQDFSNLKFFVSSISRNDLNHLPANLIKIYGMGENVKVSKVICEPLGSYSKFRIPVFNSGDSEIKHVDPVPGAKYKYSIFLRHANGENLETPIDVIHKTFNAGMPKIKLEYAGELEGTYSIVELNRENLKNVAEEIETGLQKIFSTSPGAKDFYKSIFEEKIKENIQNIGNIFQLYVQYYYTSTGNYGDPVIVELSPEDKFMIPIPAVKHTDTLINYHLIVTNPLEILSNGFEKIENPGTREVFRRRTSAFFNSISLTNGTLPVSVIDPETGREKYVDNTKFELNDPFNRVTCMGGLIEIKSERSKNLTRTYDLQSLYFPDDGECIFGWRVEPEEYDPLKENKNIDFFVVTAEINSIEFPITAHPFINFQHEYKIRTFSFLGSAANVTFKVYTVYSDYSIGYSNITTSVQITDTRKHIQEV